MIKIVRGNLFESDADCIVNTVNCEGYMGKGIAYQFKQKYPENYRQYVAFCKEGKLRPGILLPVEEQGKIIINFPTKDKWREPSRMSYITDGLEALKELISTWNIRKVAMPPLGCGNGGLEWSLVQNAIQQQLGNSPVEIEVYEPKEIHAETSNRMTARDLLLLHVRQNLQRPTSLRFQKTLYLTNYYSNEKVYSFSRGPRGPYSMELYKAAVRIGEYQRDNHLSGPEETFAAIYRTICSKSVDRQYDNLSRYADLALEIVNRMEDDLLLEGVATALFLLDEKGTMSQEEICREFSAWSEDKARRFNIDVIGKSLDQLEKLGIVQNNLLNKYEILP